jgi:heme A synthase
LPILYPIVVLVVAVILLWLLFWILQQFSLGEPFDKIVRVIAVVIAVLVLIGAIVGGQTAAMMGGGYLAHLDGAIGQVECRMDGEHPDASEGLAKLPVMMGLTRSNERKFIFVANGAAASSAEHASVSLLLRGRRSIA